MTIAKILIADDEPLYRKTTAELLKRSGYECVCVADAASAMEALRSQSFDLVLSDLNMPGNLRLELLHDHSEHRPQTPLVIITGVPSLPTAIESIRLGITDYLLKPVKFEDLLACVQRAIAKSKRPVATPSSHVNRADQSTRYPELVGNSRAMHDLLDLIDRVAHTDANILITGESGTGKEVVAKAIHDHSRRRNGNFQVIDCTAIPESLFESMLFGHKKGAFTGAISDQAGLLQQCDGGTAFFDELGELPMAHQAKLLRAVQEQTFTPVGCHSQLSVDTRFICATNRDLQMEVQAGRFRQDLFYRLGVIHIDLPPLRDRGDDCVILAEHYLERLQPVDRKISGFSPEAVKCIRDYVWPGNVRELRNAMERAIALTNDDLIKPDALPVAIQNAPLRLGPSSSSRRVPDALLNHRHESGNDAVTTLDVSRSKVLQVAEHQYLVDLLRSNRGNVSRAAQQAGMSRQGMHKLLRSHAICAEQFR